MSRVYVIIDMAIIMLLTWLAENTQDLAGYEFGRADMGAVVGLMASTFLEVMKDGNTLVDKKV